MRTDTHADEKPDPKLQAQLRGMIDASNLHRVQRGLRIGRTQLLHYLSGLPMVTATLRGIEATIRDAAKDRGTALAARER